jgi:hypothetical protein
MDFQESIGLPADLPTLWTNCFSFFFVCRINILKSGLDKQKLHYSSELFNTYV